MLSNDDRRVVIILAPRLCFGGISILYMAKYIYTLETFTGLTCKIGLTESSAAENAVGWCDAWKKEKEREGVGRLQRLTCHRCMHKLAGGEEAGVAVASRRAAARYANTSLYHRVHKGLHPNRKGEKGGWTVRQHSHSHCYHSYSKSFKQLRARDLCN
jgi:hypothetical protein